METSSSSYARHNYEEHIAHVIWAAHILHYLSGERSQTGLLPELDTDEDFDADEPDAETQNDMIQTAPIDSIRSKFLDCVSELLSPSKGWDYVVSAGLRESVECIELDIARNDGFSQTVESKKGGPLVVRDGNKWYINQLQRYLADSEDIFGTALSGFELAAINFHRNRVDYWITLAREYIATLPSSKDYKENHSAESQQAAENWTDIAELLSQKVGEVSREMIVHSAYKCISSNEVFELLQANCSIPQGLKLWRILRLITKPVFNSRLLKRIARRFSNFQKVKINPLPPAPTTKLKNEYLIDITTAWSRLCSVSPSSSELQKLNHVNDKFKLDCARTFGSHAEVQLLLHYENNDLLTPSINYFGCSKKSCLLCEALLQGLLQPISTRGHHGICYPQWTVPFTQSKGIMDSLQLLENIIVSRVKMHLSSQTDGTFIHQVPQSTVVSNVATSSLEEISKRAGIMKSIEENRKTLAKQRNILDGQTSKSDLNTASAQDARHHNSCVMCNTSPAQSCSRCKSCYYCSRECQESDWPCHKILCKQMPSLSSRPSPNHKLAIFFLETEVKPTLIWIECYRKASSEYEQYGIVVEFEVANTRPLLGKDDPFPGRLRIEYNPKRDKALGSGLAAWSPKKEGYCIELVIREAFLKDGSKLNRSIMESVKTSGTVHHAWSGPIVAMRQLSTEFYEDITLADFRHIIDYFVTYNSSEVREITNPQAPLRTTARAIRGVKICCYGEIKLHGAEPYVPIEVPYVHPICGVYESTVSPISKILGRPLRLWKFPDIETWLDPPGWDENLCADSNPDAAFLMMGADPRKNDWGWAPLYWNTEIGNVLFIYDDKTDLLVEDLRLICYFVRKKLQPMFEDAMGLGLVSRTKEEVLKFITWENMERFRKEAEDNKGAFG